MAKQYIYKNNGIKMRYATFGEGHEIIVFIPGISLKSVTPLADAIEARYINDLSRDRFTFYVFDPCDEHPEGLTIRNMSDDLSIVMDGIGLKAVNIMGVSMGGMIALAMAAYHPEQVNKLCLASAATTTPEPFKRVLPDWIRLGREHKAKELAECFADRVYSEETLKSYRESIISACLDATDHELDNYALRSEAMLKWDLGDDVHKIKVPALAIGCKGDALYGYECAIKNGELLGCETYLYGPEYGHAVYDEAPDFVDRVLQFFLS